MRTFEEGRCRSDSDTWEITKFLENMNMNINMNTNTNMNINMNKNERWHQQHCGTTNGGISNIV